MPDLEKGTRIRLDHTSDPYTKLRPGTLGTVRAVRNDQVSVRWDDGSTLSMLIGEDSFSPTGDVWPPIVGETPRSGQVSWGGDELDPTFEAIWDPSVRWNGWLCPWLDRENTQKLVEYNNTAATLPEGEYGSDVDTFSWDGDVLVQTYRGDGSGEVSQERIEPRVDRDGRLRWTPGSFSWTWCDVTPSYYEKDVPGHVLRRLN